MINRFNISWNKMVIVPKVKLNFVFLNIEFIMSAATLEYTLYISVASTCKFR